jgi:hypothetical protein
MKKIFVLAVFIMAAKFSFADSINDIDQRIKERFHALYPQAQGEVWTEYPESYGVCFINCGIQERAFYAKDGSYTELIRYYGGDSLPADLQLMLSDRLKGKTVFGVTEVSTVGRPEVGATVQYQIVMEDDAHWYHVFIDNRDEPRIVKKYRKA